MSVALNNQPVKTCESSFKWEPTPTHLYLNECWWSARQKNIVDVPRTRPIVYHNTERKRVIKAPCWIRGKIAMKWYSSPCYCPAMMKLMMMMMMNKLNNYCHTGPTGSLITPVWFRNVSCNLFVAATQMKSQWARRSSSRRRTRGDSYRGEKWKGKRKVERENV